MDYVYWFNVFEATLWTCLGLLSLFYAIKLPSRRRHLMAIGLLFFTFAVSEVIETQTGAWWKPWWLAVWKGLCVVGLLVMGRGHYLWQKSVQGTTEKG